ncbi:hypothetical protein FQR65_LT19319 [Abscondita terminalis]|nr:hypothetical protein FQR65_LT19319 [Abscondita terminalis]
MLQNQVIYVSATPADYELQKTGGEYVEQIIRPTGLLDPIIEVRPTQNQIDDLIEEIQKRTEEDERVLRNDINKENGKKRLTKYFSRFGIRTRYIHSDVGNSGKESQIMQDLRAGLFDVLVGVNLLREGLDLPEVSLVAILDADKEGMLRSRRSLIQTIGSCSSRNLNGGKRLCIADKITKSMQAAIDETNYRREKQMSYNKERGQEPQALNKKISESLVRRTPDFPDQKYIQKEILQKVGEVQANYSSDEIEKSIAKKQKRKWSLLSFPETFESYKKGFDIVMKNLQLGNSYLINYTRKTKIETNLTLQDIFYHSEAKYKICYKNNWVFFSPEVFVKIENQKVSTFPMKGTIDADIPDAENILKNDPKEKAEHYTVVDLLRNDLSIVADDVKLVDFQRIDYLQTLKKNLYTMSSEIEGTVKPSFKNKIGTIMQKLLPAGSILGAPKDKTQEVILKSESYDRGFYTGVCGYFDGKDLDSGVMIRFIENESNNFIFKSAWELQPSKVEASARYQGNDEQNICSCLLKRYA